LRNLQSFSCATFVGSIPKSTSASRRNEGFSLILGPQLPSPIYTRSVNLQTRGLEVRRPSRQTGLDLHCFPSRTSQFNVCLDGAPQGRRDHNKASLAGCSPREPAGHEVPAWARLQSAEASLSVSPSSRQWGASAWPRGDPGRLNRSGAARHSPSPHQRLPGSFSGRLARLESSRDRGTPIRSAFTGAGSLRRCFLSGFAESEDH
jgi:hypothetical protein